MTPVFTSKQEVALTDCAALSHNGKRLNVDVIMRMIFNFRALCKTCTDIEGNTN